MLLNKETICLDINKNISIFRINEEDYNNIIRHIDKNEILFDKICTDSYQVFINIFPKTSHNITTPSFYKDHILILNSIPMCLSDYFLERSIMATITCNRILIEKELIMNGCYRNQIDLNITCF